MGLAYLSYGKKQLKMSAMIAGLLLCVIPYFVSNGWAMLGVGAGLVAAPFLVAF